MGWAELVLDNPILVKHVRSRLRPGQALPWAAIVLVLAAGVAWAGHNVNWIGNASATMLLLGLQVLILAFGGANQVTASLGGARESGILDFHRVSPLPPAAMALGFFLGAPIREYVLAAIAVPFAAFSAYHVDLEPARGLLWLAQLETALILSVWLVHAAAMLGCLTRKRPRGSTVGSIVTVLVLLFVAYLASIGFYFGARWLLEEDRTMNLFGRMIPWLAWLALYELPALGFLGLAAARKIGAERTHPYTKAQAVACMATLTVLTVGGLWGIARLLPTLPPHEPTQSDVIMLAATYVLAMLATILAIAITPDAGEYVKGVRRALHEGRRRPGPWTDAGTNRLALCVLGALVLAGATAVVNVVGRPPQTDNLAQFGQWLDPTSLAHAQLADDAWVAMHRAMMSRPIAVAVLTVAYAGLAFQYFSLRTRSSGLALTALFLFVVWLVPVLVGSIVGMGGPPAGDRALVILALSPLPGIALSSGLGRLTNPDAIQLAALAPPITFAFVFNYLLVLAQRKIDRQLHVKGPIAAPAPAVRVPAVPPSAS